MFAPYWVLLIPYGIGLTIFLVWMGFNMSHLMKYGFFDFTGKLTFFLFLGLSIIIVGFTGLILADIDWTMQLNLLDLPSTILPFPTSFGPKIVN